MIGISYKEDIIKRLAAVITYGLNNKYSFGSIEEYIVSSTFINDLENNKYNIEESIEHVVESTYKIKLDKDADISFKGIFFAESYVKLFFEYNKSFEYLFLYWPLSNFFNKYNVYHEMDISNLKRDFESNVKETSLLKKLSKTKHIKLTEISELTNININTINKYSKDDKYLYKASYEITYKLSRLFNVKDNMFIKNLNVYFDESIYLYSNIYKELLNYLGLYYATYYDKRLSDIKFDYDKKNNIFINKDKKLKLIVVAQENKQLDINALKHLLDPKTYLVIFPVGYTQYNLNDYSYLESLKVLDILIVRSMDITILKKGITKEITDTINKSLLIKAKTDTSKHLSL